MENNLLTVGIKMIVYNKFGYKIKAFQKEDGIEMFKYFIEHRMFNNRKETGKYSRRRTLLKNEVNESLNAKNHTPLGIYKDKELVGICLVFVNNKMPIVPELKYIHIKKEYIDGIAPYIIFNFIIHILYEGESIKIKNGKLKKFGSIVRQLPGIIGFSIFNNNFINNLNKYFKDK